MVAKVDQEEIYSDLYQQSIIISVLTGILILLCGIGIMWIYHFRQRNIYRTLWQVQEEYRTTLYSIGDAVITTDTSGRVRYMNVVAEQLTGWEEGDAKNNPLEKVFHIINEVTRVRVQNPSKQRGRDGAYGATSFR
ncbi:MAG: PAS domain-containing protein [Bacteroidetes bacterium]|nr:PAS domain-containing protein [Bacteroidota bacterium]